MDIRDFSVDCLTELIFGLAHLPCGAAIEVAMVIFSAHLLPGVRVNRLSRGNEATVEKNRNSHLRNERPGKCLDTRRQSLSRSGVFHSAECAGLDRHACHRGGTEFSSSTGGFQFVEIATLRTSSRERKGCIAALFKAKAESGRQLENKRARYRNLGV